MMYVFANRRRDEEECRVIESIHRIISVYFRSVSLLGEPACNLSPESESPALMDETGSKRE